MDNTKNSDDSGLTLQFDGFRKVIDSLLFADVKEDNADAFFQIAQEALHYNCMGFAWTFCKLAAKHNHSKAKKCLTLLEDKQLSIALRRQKCLDLIMG